MKISDFHYDFPENLVAVEALEDRSSARLTIVDRVSEKTSESIFKSLAESMDAESVLVLNQSFVLPARFFAKRPTGGQLEGLLLQAEKNQVRAWIQGTAREEESIEIPGFGSLKVLSREERECVLETNALEFIEFLKTSGRIALPPYIRRCREAAGLPEEVSHDKENYQTVFSKMSSQFSIAAPTASLHFDEDLLRRLTQKGVEILKLSLHVGPATFQPVEVERTEDLNLPSEIVEVENSVRDRIFAAKEKGKKIVAVGTTVLRALESLARSPKSESLFFADVTVKPSFEFRLVDQLITNFHLPSSSLLVLVASFLEAKNKKAPEQLQGFWKKVYSEAIQKKMRLFSYGDGMWIR